MVAEVLEHVGAGDILQWEATQLSRVEVACEPEVKAGDLVAYALANKAFPALQDAVNGKTVIQPLNCIIDANFVNGDVTDLLGAWLGYGVSVINVPTATPDAEENGGGE